MVRSRTMNLKWRADLRVGRSFPRFPSQSGQDGACPSTWCSELQDNAVVRIGRIDAKDAGAHGAREVASESCVDGADLREGGLHALGHRRAGPLAVGPRASRAPAKPDSRDQLVFDELNFCSQPQMWGAAPQRTPSYAEGSAKGLKRRRRWYVRE